MVTEFTGHLKFINDLSDNTTKEILADFELLDTASRFVNATLWDVYVRWGVVIGPEFKEIYRVTPLRSCFITQ